MSRADAGSLRSSSRLASFVRSSLSRRWRSWLFGCVRPAGDRRRSSPRCISARPPGRRGADARNRLSLLSVHCRSVRAVRLFGRARHERRSIDSSSSKYLSAARKSLISRKTFPTRSSASDRSRSASLSSRLRARTACGAGRAPPRAALSAVAISLVRARTAPSLLTIEASARIRTRFSGSRAISLRWIASASS